MQASGLLGVWVRLGLGTLRRTARCQATRAGLLAFVLLAGALLKGSCSCGGQPDSFFGPGTQAAAVGRQRLFLGHRLDDLLDQHASHTQAVLGELGIVVP
jgi:hypothetical protein